MKEKIKVLAILLLTVSIFSCIQDKTTAVKPAESIDVKGEVSKINMLLDSFNIAAASADFNKYFSYFTESATFNGTDATENWDKKTYMAWAKPYFDAKTTWNFKSVKRNVYFGEHGDIAWFDELLSTQMKICRGSGVIVKQNNQWKVQQYVLSMTVPNSQLDKAIEIKTKEEDSLLNSYQR